MTGRRLLWTLGTLLSTLVVLVSSAYLRFDPALYFDEQRAVYLAHQVPLYLHVTGAMLALATAPWQLSRTLRRRAPRVHRVLGRLFGAGVLVGGIGGLGLAPTAFGGPVARVGFAALAVAWLSTTALGISAARRRDLATHRRWMVRAVALTFAAVTLRLYLVAWGSLDAAGLAPGTFAQAYAAVAWLAWVPNLAVAWALTRDRSGGRDDVRLTSAAWQT